MHQINLSHAHWFKSSHSGDANNTCIEVATNLPGTIAVRDSTNPTGPTLTFTPTTWKTFTNKLKNDQIHPHS